MAFDYERLAVQLQENGSPDVEGRDKVSLKVEAISPLYVQRNPIIISLPAGTICGIDLGRNNG